MLLMWYPVILSDGIMGKTAPVDRVSVVAGQQQLDGLILDGNFYGSAKNGARVSKFDGQRSIKQ